MSKKLNKILVKGEEITVLKVDDDDYISLTDMLRAKDGDFFISDWLRNRNTVEYLGIWERIHNPNFNYGGFATIRSQAGLNSYKISEEMEQSKRLEKLNRVAIKQMQILLEEPAINALNAPKDEK